MVVRATTSTTATVPFGILDVYGGASHAYSLRKLRRAYSGPLIRVRRGNDNAEQDISFTQIGDIDEAALIAFVGVNSGFITTWYDQSGSGNNAVQITAAKQPRIVNAGVIYKLNNRPSVEFLGTGQGFTFTPSASSPRTLINVNSGIGYMFAGTDQRIVVQLSPFLFMWGATPNVIVLPSWRTTTSFQVEQLDYAGTSYEIFKNGASVVNGVTSPATLNALNRIGLQYDAVTGLSTWLGGMSEVLIFGSVLSSDGRAFIAENEVSYYGLV